MDAEGAEAEVVMMDVAVEGEDLQMVATIVDSAIVNNRVLLLTHLAMATYPTCHQALT